MNNILRLKQLENNKKESGAINIHYVNKPNPDGVKSLKKCFTTKLHICLEDGQAKMKKIKTKFSEKLQSQGWVLNPSYLVFPVTFLFRWFFASIK